MDEDKIKIKSPEEITIEEKSFEEDNNTITTPAEPTSQDAVPETPPVPNTAASEPTQPEPVAPEPAQPESVLVASESLIEDSESKPSHKARNIFIVVLVLTLAALGTFTTFAIINHNNQKTEQESPNTPEKDQELDPSLKLSSNSLSDFDLEFLKLENESENKIYSPLSIKYALAMLKDGAAGDSKTQIENLIGNYTPKAYINSENRSLANALFVRDTFKESIKESYVKDINTKYAAELITDAFNSANTVNNWVNEKTLGIIPNIIQDDFLVDKDFILANALAIDMNWNNQIQCEYDRSGVPCIEYKVNYSHEKYSDSIETIMKPQNGSGYESIKFDTQENTKAVRIGASINKYNILKEIGEDKIREIIKTEYTEWLTNGEGKALIGTESSPEQDVDKFVDKYMEELNSNYGKVDFSTDFMMYDDEDIKVFAKDLKEYDGDILQYVGIMPKTVSLIDYAKSSDAKKISNVINNLKPIELNSFKEGVVTKILGNIPMFSYDYELQLKKDLQELGVNDVFDGSKANLSDLTSGAAFIADAIHVANIDFSNNGIKAAAATLMAGTGATVGPHFEHLWDVPVEEIDLTFDKPFLFLIRDKASGEVWFTGTVYKPSTNE